MSIIMLVVKIYIIHIAIGYIGDIINGHFVCVIFSYILGNISVVMVT